MSTWKVGSCLLFAYSKSGPDAELQRYLSSVRGLKIFPCVWLIRIVELEELVFGIIPYLDPADSFTMVRITDWVVGHSALVADDVVREFLSGA